MDDKQSELGEQRFRVFNDEMSKREETGKIHYCFPSRDAEKTPPKTWITVHKGCLTKEEWKEHIFQVAQRLIQIGCLDVSIEFKEVEVFYTYHPVNVF